MRIKIRLWVLLVCIFVGWGCHPVAHGAYYLLEKSQEEDVNSVKWQKGNTWRQEKATSELDKQVCRFDCNEDEKACFNLIDEDKDGSREKQRCEKEKEMCFKQC